VNLSIVIPARNEELSISELVIWIEEVMNKNHFTYEIIFVDDGSTDNTWDKMVSLNKSHPNVKCIRFSRNYGKSAALQTGFTVASGDVVITMDADLQDSPEEIPDLYAMIKEEKFHLVSGWKIKRQDPLSKTLPSLFFNYTTKIISGIKLHDFNCGLKAYQSVVVKNISVYGEMHRYIPLLAKWTGFTRIGEKAVVHHKRKYGKTNFGWERFMRGFLDLLTLTFVGRFSRRPMHFFGFWGSLMFLVGIGFTLKIFWDKLDALWISKIPIRREVTQQPIFYLALVSVVLGVQLFLTGFLAELIAQKSNSKKDHLIIDKVGL